ncbi:phage baseplate assembly protein V [Allorhizocola rhizosphaerae]|uniref:phage baseplate assembly protein V n=1 Tax=Allorhizocola rhizosphaerae TaxID=1872709 RepID=UPI0013C30E9D|nr:phage baseplate assembly protein V [Allorhizocola rhizosphaerae]
MRMPTIDVTLNGRRIPARILALRVSEKLSQPTQAQVTISGAPEGNDWPLGASMTVTVAEAELFTGEVTAVETIHNPGSERAWILRAYDRLHGLRKRQQPRVFEDVTLADLAKQLTGEDVECAPTGRIPRLVQHRQTDWDLLTQTAARCGRYIVLTGPSPRVIDLRPQGQPLQLGQDLWQLRVEANTDGRFGSVTAIGWDSQRGEFLTENAHSDLDGERTLVDQSPALLAEAATAAVSRGRIHLEGVANGNPALRPGRAVGVSTVDGVYTVTSAVHTIDADGYRTCFSTEPPTPTSHATGASITLGRVTSVQGGDGLVRVSLPAYGDIDAGWLGVLCPGAGPGKGIVALPDPGDLVLIALPHENPAEGIVLGALYGPADPPDHGVVGDRVKRWTMHSSSGQTIVIDDDRKTLKLSNADGSALELAPDLVSLTAKTDMVIEAPGHHLSIRAAKVDFEHAVLP